MQQEKIIHPFGPVYDPGSRILILGSLPSVRSRQDNFFYAHPRNRFWSVLARVLEKDEPRTVEEKLAFLHGNHIALWDVIQSCEISGSSDSSIRNAVPTDLRRITESSGIEAVFVNGRKACELYGRYQEKELGMAAVYLPSTSPANAACSMERLVSEWSRILPYITGDAND